MDEQSFSARRVHCCYHQGWALQWNEVFLGKRGLLNTYISPWLRSSLLSLPSLLSVLAFVLFWRSDLHSVVAFRSRVPFWCSLPDSGVQL